MANKINRLFILLATFTTASATIGLIREWSDYKRTYGKNYNIFDDAYRKAIYISNNNQIKLHNLRFARGCETYELGVNQFTDRTYAEFASVFEESSTLLPQGNPFHPTGACNNIKDNAIPWDNFDMRNLGGVTPVKDQGLTCSTGWAFAALSSLEGRAFAAGELPSSLSAQNLIDCITPQTCTSKSPIDAYMYIIREQNVNTEISYPYIGKPGTCKYLSTDLGAACASYSTLTGEEDEIRGLVMTTGPVAFEFDPLSFSFMHYKSGVFRAPPLLKPSTGRHYMTIIGFGNDAQGGNYWSAKNSFGTTWGEDGYIRIATNDRNGPVKSPSFPIIF